MSALAFVASLAQSLVWPAAAVVVVLIFRKPIGELIPRIKGFKAGPVEATIGDALASVKFNLLTMSDAWAGAVVGAGASQRDVVSGISRNLHWGWQAFARTDRRGIPESAGEAEDAASITSRYTRQALTIRGAANDAAPAVTVLGAWSVLESLLNELARLLGIRGTGSFGLLADEVITALDRRGGLPASDHARSVVQTLLKLKLAVEGGAALTRLEAIDYADSTLQIMGLLLAAYMTPKVKVTASVGEESFAPPRGDSETP